MKRGVILSILFFILLTSTAYSANLELNLTRTDISAAQTFDGFLKFNFTQPLQKDIQIFFYINNKVHNVSLEKIFEQIEDEQILPPSTEKTGSPTQSILLTFTEPETQYIGLDISEGGTNTPSDISLITDLKLSIKGEQHQNTYPTSPTINIGNDADKEYTYKGPEKTSYQSLQTPYLADQEPDGLTVLKGAGDPVLCQNITLPPAQTFKIKARIKQLTTGAAINATISPHPLTFADCGEKGCCQITNIGDSLAEHSCDLKYEVQETSDHYLCIFTSGGDITTEYYEIGTDLDSTDVQGYVNGQEDKKDYYIYGSWKEFETQLKTKESITFTQEDIFELTDYIYAPGCDVSCLLIPLAITSDSKGKLTFSDLELKYQTLTTTKLTSFTPISIFKERINYTETLNINLNTLTNIIAPEKEGEYEIYAQFLDQETDKIKFNVIQGPVSIIRLSTIEPVLGETIYFDASSSYSPQDNELVSYEWDFGDKTTASGLESSHAYEKPGIYTVTLTSTDTEGLSGKSTRTLEIKSLKESIIILIDSRKEKAEELQTKISQDSTLNEISSLLKLQDLISSSLTNLTLLKSNAEQVIADTELNESQRNQKLLEIKQSLDTLELPLDIFYSTTKFDAKPSLPADIPSSLALQYAVENFQEKAFSAQATITASGEAHLLSISYPTTAETFILIKKTIAGLGENYELLPLGAVLKQIYSPADTTQISSDIIKFPGTSIVYSIEGSDVDIALQTKTIVIPADLEAFAKEIEEITVCGNGICEFDETEELCPEDCKPKRPFVLITVIIVIILGIGIFYIYFYKGKYSFQELFGKKVPVKKLFKSEKDYNVVKSYMEKSFEKGFTEDQIRLALKKQGWIDNQIEAVLKEVKKEKPKKKK